MPDEHAPVIKKRPPRQAETNGRTEGRAPGRRAIADPNVLKVSDEFSAGAVDAARKLQVGISVRFHGRTKAFAGKTVTVVGFKRDAGVWVERDGRRSLCSPFSLGDEKGGEDMKKRTKPVTAKKPATTKKPAATVPADPVSPSV